MSHYLVVNFDRREYLAPGAFGEDDDLVSVLTSYHGVLTALAVLLADGNGRGGGDLNSNSSLVGSWAGCRVGIIDDELKHPEFSEPGLEDVALYRQVLATGKDVSAQVFDVLKQAEGDYWACSVLNAQHVLPLTAQRKLPEQTAPLLLSAEGRARPLRTTDELFGIFGVSAALTPYSAVRQLQKGLDNMAAAFGRDNPWEVLGVKFHYGLKPTNVSIWSGHNQAKRGVVRVSFELRERSCGAAHAIRVRLGPEGDTCAKLYERLFPGVRFEHERDLSKGVRSPEVARLLSTLKLDAGTAARDEG